MGEHEYQNEKFIVTADGGRCALSVTDGMNTATISVDSGNFNVRNAAGWGNWETTLERALDLARRLIIEARKNKTNEERCDEIHHYIGKTN